MSKVRSDQIKSLKNCPFCGSKAEIRSEKERVLIVGCSLVSSDCPMPSVALYIQDDDTFDFTPWNRRS